MFRRGPIPPFVHGVLDYILGVVLIATPFVLNFDDNAAIALSIAVGIGALILAAFTSWTTGIVRSIPVLVHVLIDYALSIFLIVAPFVLGFSDDNTASACFVVLGILGLLITVATRYMPAPKKTPSPSPTPPAPPTAAA